MGVPGCGIASWDAGEKRRFGRTKSWDQGFGMRWILRILIDFGLGLEHIDISPI